MLSRKWHTIFVLMASLVFALKLVLAYSTGGAPDMSLWESFLAHIQSCGTCVYQTGGLMLFDGGERVNPFNHPPFIIHYLRALNFISDHLHLNFRFVFRLITSLVDTGSAVLVYRLLIRDGLFTPWRFLFYLIAPATIIISGYHGNTDTVMIFFVLLSAFLIEKPGWSGFAFGMALNIKIVPIMFLIVFLAYLKEWRFRWKFLAVAGLTIIACSLPFILQDPILIVREVLAYGSKPGRWGLTRVLFGFTGQSNLFFVVSRLMGYALLAYIFYLSVQINRHKRIPLMIRLGLVAFFFMAFTPAWGSNYMAWLDPFPITLGIVPAITYYSASGFLLSYLYFILDDERTRLMVICWLAVLIVAWRFIRMVRMLRA